MQLMQWPTFGINIIQHLKGLLIPGAIGSVCPGISLDPPPSSVFLANLSNAQLTLLIIGSILAFVIIGNAAIQLYLVWRFVSVEKRQNMLYFVIVLLPFSSCCTLIGMFIPRSAIMMSSIGIFYYLICLFVLSAFHRHLNEGRANIVAYLKYRRRLINLQSAPCCCFLWFLPELEPKETYLRTLEWMVLQAPIVRMLVLISDVAAISDFRATAKHWFHWSDVGTFTSSMMAVFGIHTLSRMTGDKLSKFQYMRIFRMVDLALFIYAVQPLLFEFAFVWLGVFECGTILSPVDSAKFVCNFLIICEMLFFAVLSSWLVTPKYNALFDKFEKIGVEKETAVEERVEQSLSIATTMVR